MYLRRYRFLHHHRHHDLFHYLEIPAHHHRHHNLFHYLEVPAQNRYKLLELL